MPDDIKVPAATGDDTVAPPVATDLVGGRHFQRIKSGFGADGVYTDTIDLDGFRFPVGGGQLGATTEPAPNTDIASSGLNGRLQRIAQRLSTIIGLLPPSIGQKTMASSLSVALASDQPSLPVTLLRRESVLSLTVPNGTTISNSIDTAGYGNMGLIVPSTFDGTTIFFQVSDILAGTYVNLYDITGTPVQMTIVPSRAYDLPGELMAWRFLQITCGTTQAGATSFQVVLRS